jgi:ribosomal-protein-alanine N-acetyltransferase
VKPWEATFPNTDDAPRSKSISFRQMIKQHRVESREGRSFSFGIFLKNELIGQITIGGIIYGALRSGHIGYWIAEKNINQGFATEAVIGITNFGFEVLQLHRIEINVRPENQASIKVAKKAGYKFEGERKNYLHIDGSWRDHDCFVLENSQII